MKNRLVLLAFVSLAFQGCGLLVAPDHPDNNTLKGLYAVQYPQDQIVNIQYGNTITTTNAYTPTVPPGSPTIPPGTFYPVKLEIADKPKATQHAVYVWMYKDPTGWKLANPPSDYGSHSFESATAVSPNKYL